MSVKFDGKHGSVAHLPVLLALPFGLGRPCCLRRWYGAEPLRAVLEPFGVRWGVLI